MQWINLYGPKNLSECYFHKNEMEECIQWINNYKKDFNNTKKILMIVGHTGSGKTKLAQLLLEEFNYQIIEYNSSDTRSQKKITEVLDLEYLNSIIEGSPFNIFQHPFTIPYWNLSYFSTPILSECHLNNIPLSCYIVRRWLIFFM